MARGHTWTESTQEVKCSDKEKSMPQARLCRQLSVTPSCLRPSTTKWWALLAVAEKTGKKEGNP